MKHMLKRILLGMLCLMLVLPAMAESVVMPDEKTSGYTNIVATAAVGDTLYLLKSDKTNAQLLYWQEGMEGAEILKAATTAYAPFFNSLEEIESATEAGDVNDAGADGEYALSHIFSDGEQLYGLNHLNGRIFTIDVVGGNSVVQGDVVTVQYPALFTMPGVYGYGGYEKPWDAVVVGNWLLWHVYDRVATGRNFKLLAYNLETGTVKQAVLPNSETVIAWKEGKALVLCQENGQPYTLYSYNPATDETVFLTELESSSVSGIRSIAYSKELDMVIYQDKTKLLGWSPDGVEQVGFIPTSMSIEGAQCVGDKLLYSTTNNSGITTATLQKGYADTSSLNIMGGNMNTVISRFSRNWNGIPFYYTNKPEDASWADVLMGDNAPDMVLLDVTRDDYTRLLECGYFMDISQYAGIREYTDVLYTPYKNLVSREQAIYGVPTVANSYNGWYINKEVAAAMGLGSEDIPTDLVSMIEFAQKWNDEWAEKYPHFTLLNGTTGYKMRFLEVLMDEWQEYCQFYGKALTFDDPIVREVLTALDKVDFTKIDAALHQTDPEISEYKQALIWTGCKDVGNFATYMEESSDRIFIPLTLTRDTPYIAAVDNVDVWVVNAKSDNAEYAAALLAQRIEKIDNVHAYVLRTDKTEPVIDSYWEEDIAIAQERITQLEARVEESVNKDTILRQIELAKQVLAEKTEHPRYSINPSAIKNYVEVIAPASVILDYDLGLNGYTDEIIYSMEALHDKRITVEEFISRMNELI